MAVNIDDLIASTTSGGDTSTTVRVADGTSAKTKSGSGIQA